MLINFRVPPAKKKLFRFPLKRWQKRKEKYYNPEGVCKNCNLSTETLHSCYCKGCLSYFRCRNDDDFDFQDTINSIQADWHK